MNELEFQTIRIGEEQSVVPFAILGIVGGWIEDFSADLDKHPVQPIDRVGNLNAPVLGLYGGEDPGIPAATVEQSMTIMLGLKPGSRP